MQNEEMLQVGQINDMVGSIRSLSMGEFPDETSKQHNCLEEKDNEANESSAAERSVYITAIGDLDEDQEVKENHENSMAKRDGKQQNITKMYYSCINIPEAVDYRSNQSFEVTKI